MHSAADAVSDVPVLGTVAQGTATSIDMATQLAGGFSEGAVGLAGGLAKGVVDPVDAAKGIYSLGGKLLPATMLNAAENDLTGA